MTYTTLQYQGTEKSLADWGVSSWNRIAQNQGEDSFTLTIPTPMDGTSIFPYGANIIIRINRACSAVNPVNPTLPQTGSTNFSGGTQWFWGYCIDEDRTGEPANESFTYKFVGPYQFFFDRLIFQKYQLTWNGAEQIVDWQSDVVLGLSLNSLSGTGDTVEDSTATNLMSIAQQIKEICMYAQNDSAYQQGINGLSWPSGAQFQCDQLTTEVDGVNWDLLETPSTNVLIADYVGTALSGKTSASTLTSGSYMLRCPLDAANAITCAEAMRRQLQWLPTNPLNQGSQGIAAESTNPGAQAPGSGANDGGFKSFFGNLPTNVSSPASLPQGVHIDAAGNWGGGSAPAASGTDAQIVIANAPGGSQSWIRVCVADLPAGATMKIQGPYAVCLNGVSRQVYFLIAITS